MIPKSSCQFWRSVWKRTSPFRVHLLSRSDTVSSACMCTHCSPINQPHYFCALHLRGLSPCLRKVSTSSVLSHSLSGLLQGVLAEPPQGAMAQRQRVWLKIRRLDVRTEHATRCLHASKICDAGPPAKVGKYAFMETMSQEARRGILTCSLANRGQNSWKPKSDRRALSPSEEADGGLVTLTLACRLDDCWQSCTATVFFFHETPPLSKQPWRCHDHYVAKQHAHAHKFHGGQKCNNQSKQLDDKAAYARQRLGCTRTVAPQNPAGPEHVWTGGVAKLPNQWTPLDKQLQAPKENCWKACNRMLPGSLSSQSPMIMIPARTAQGGGGSFKDRKPIGAVGCCDAWMAEQSHWWIERWLERRPISSVYLSACPTNWLTNQLPNKLSN